MSKEIAAGFVSHVELLHSIHHCEKCDESPALLHHNAGPPGTLGYIDLAADETWKRKGRACEWQHRIELESPSLRGDSADCPLFGHRCPSGKTRAAQCRGMREEVESQ